MKILNRRKIVQEKLDLIKAGYSAYAESFEIATLLKKEIQALNLQVHEDITNVGSWFIPEKVK
ncbi:hypothetical protein IMZ08_09340 [Bacillus luteolus]|uniref:Uncharacterized protein n=1 Tax=Litchfieldia luteola TaxID=682179 RepID=A0ABR9QID1_9BACI|nr:hypothetical protein [Cytobacillus luteolus]MBE4908258.1 hypothetical protein [Cytobacillus luteolus]MBP1943044.1 hypothetical protein [Cytobacillus luteolus]